MIFIKKALNNYEAIDTSSFKDNVDAINKAVLPSKMLIKKKKNKENKEK